MDEVYDIFSRHCEDNEEKIEFVEELIEELEELLEGLKNKTADLNKDGKIYLSELQQYVQGNVSKLTGGRQRPISRQVNINNDYVFWTCN